MHEPRIDEPVQLTQDLPELGLHRGEVGRVCSSWFVPTTAFEVEFQVKGLDYKPRALLFASQVQAEPR
jgi:Domain of unknown function (DUF4926)